MTYRDGTADSMRTDSALFFRSAEAPPFPYQTLTPPSRMASTVRSRSFTSVWAPDGEPG